MCSGVWCFGLLVQLFMMSGEEVFGTTLNNLTNVEQLTAALATSARPDPYSVKFFPFAAFGGALWATGNTLSVPVIHQLISA